MLKKKKKSDFSGLWCWKTLPSWVWWNYPQDFSTTKSNEFTQDFDALQTIGINKALIVYIILNEATYSFFKNM